MDSVKTSLILVSYFMLVSSFASQETIGNGRDLYEQALSEYRQGEVNTALIHIKNLLKQNTNNLPARLLFGKILLEYGELAAAEDQYLKALELNADPSVVMLPLAQSLLLQSKYEKLLATIYPQNFSVQKEAHVYVYRSKAYLGLGMVEDARYSLDKALAIDPKSLDAILGLASLAIREDQQAEFDRQIEKAKELAPNNSHVWYYQGESLRALGKIEQALSAYNKAIQLQDNNISARRSRAIIFIDTNQLNKAKSDIDYILTKQPGEPFTLLIQALYLAKTNEFKQAEEILTDTSLKLSQLNAETINQYAPLSLIHGVTHFMLGRYIDAQKSLRAYLDKNPNNVEARELLAEIAFAQDKFNTVNKLLSLVKPQFTSQRSAVLLLTSLLKQENFSDAVLTYLALPERLRNQAQLQKLYALALIQTGQAKQAMAILEGHSMQPQVSLNSQLTLGYNYLHFGLFEQARELAEKLATQSNLPTPVLNFIGTSYQSTNELVLAEKYYRLGLTQSPSDTIVGSNLVQLLIELENYQDADILLDELMENSPNLLALIKLKGRLNIAQNKLEQALNWYEKAEQLESEDLTIKHQLLNLYLNTNQANKALEQSNKIRLLEPLSEIALIGKSKAYLQKKDYKQAAKPLRILFGLFLNDPEKLYAIVDLQLQARDWLYTEKTISQIEDLDSSTTDAVELKLLKAKLHFFTNKVEDAIKLLQSLPQKNAEVNENLARFQASIGNASQAIEYARKAHNQQASTKSLELLTGLYWQEGLQQEATDTLLNWLKSHPKDVTSRKVLASLLEQRGALGQATKAYEELLQHTPDSIFALNNLALLYLVQSRPQLALQLAQKARKFAPYDAKVNDTLGWVLVQNASPEQGLSFLREALARDVDNPTYLYHTAIALADLGRKRESIMELKTALDSTRSFKEKPLAQQKLLELEALLAN